MKKLLQNIWPYVALVLIYGGIAYILFFGMSCAQKQTPIKGVGIYKNERPRYER